jgi:peptide chain release factor 1
MLEKLAGIEQRFHEINQQLMEVGNDYQRAADLSIERSELEPLARRADEYRALLKRLEEARAILENEAEDEDMHLLAEAEISELELELERIEEEIKGLLVPKINVTAQRHRRNPCRHRRR